MNELLSASRELSNWLRQQVNDQEPILDEHSWVSARCFNVAWEHHTAILTLLSAERPMSASIYALVRPSLDHYVRGIWLFALANDTQFHTFVNGQSPTTESLIQSLQKIQGDGGVSQLKAMYDDLDAEFGGNGSGARSLSLQRGNGGFDFDACSLEAVARVLAFSARICVLSAAGLALLSGNRDLWQRILNESIPKVSGAFDMAPA